MNSNRSFDALVAGGGPGGLAAAIEVARGGLEVGIVDRPQSGPDKGETLAPAGAAVLRGLGVWDAFLRGAHRPCYAYRSVWGSPSVSSFDTVRDPFGNAWILDRPALIDALRCAAMALGVTLLEWEATPDFDRVESGWLVRRRAGGSLFARFLIDATGRTSAVARRLGARRMTADRQIAVLAAIAGEEQTPSESMLVEAVDGGWWYSVHAPRVGLMLAFFTDRDLIDLRAARTQSGFRALLAKSRATCGRASAIDWPSIRPPVAMAAQSSALDRICGDRWIAVGDAALAYDPLSGHGLTLALASGRDGGMAVRASLAGDHAGLAQYAERMARAGKTYELRRSVQYAAERRWRDFPFWRRRMAS